MNGGGVRGLEPHVRTQNHDKLNPPPPPRGTDGRNKHKKEIGEIDWIVARGREKYSGGFFVNDMFYMSLHTILQRHRINFRSFTKIRHQYVRLKSGIISIKITKW